MTEAFDPVVTDSYVSTSTAKSETGRFEGSEDMGWPVPVSSRCGPHEPSGRDGSPDKDLLWLPMPRSTDRKMKPKKKTALVGKKETGAI